MGRVEGKSLNLKKVSLPEGSGRVLDRDIIRPGFSEDHLQSLSFPPHDRAVFWRKRCLHPEIGYVMPRRKSESPK